MSRTQTWGRSVNRLRVPSSGRSGVSGGGLDGVWNLCSSSQWRLQARSKGLSLN